MAATNRSAKLTKLVNALKKRYKPTVHEPRPLFETLLYACLLENSTHDDAGKALKSLESGYFDWNEVRVSSRAELAEVLKPLNDPSSAADRLKRTLQSLFETFYTFDLESMKKQNLGQSVKQIEKQDGVTPFVVAYVIQNGLAGHSIPCNRGVIIAMHVLDIITDAERKKGVVPGLERVVPKNKGVDFGSVLHQLGVEIVKNPYGTAAKKLLTDLDPSCKDRLPKKPKPTPPPAPAPAPSPTKKTAAKPAADKAKTAKPTGSKAAKPAAAKSATAKDKKVASPAKKPVAAKATAAKPAASKKTATKKTTKKAAVKPAAKTASKKTASKKKPAKKAGSAKKATPKKGAAKKVAKKVAKKTTAATGKKPTKKAAKKKPR